MSENYKYGFVTDIENEAFENDAAAAAGDGRGRIPNPERRGNLRACKAEETILASLLKNPDYLSRYSSSLSADCFITKVNRELFESISVRIKNNRPLELSYFSEDSSNDEISILSYLTVFGNTIAGTTAEFEDCIETLASEKIKKSASSAEGMTDEEFLKLMGNKRKKTGV